LITMATTALSSLEKEEKLPPIQQPGDEKKSNYKRNDESSRIRIAQLARPKISKAVWETIEPPIVWGNQEPMKPLSKAAVLAQPSQRIGELSTPKRNFQLDHPSKCSRHYYLHSCGRSSVIWDVNTNINTRISRRLEELSEPKKLHQAYSEDRTSYVLSCGRSSPIMMVSEGAKKAPQRTRTSDLSKPKEFHRDYQIPREVEWPVSQAAKKAQTSARIESLATPKDRKEGPVRSPEWVVSKGARYAKAGSRVLELAQPKKLTESYRPNRDVEWRVPRSALHATATSRMNELATPIIRATMDHVQFDPLAFQVKVSALKGKVPDRVFDLSQPVSRPGPKPLKR